MRVCPDLGRPGAALLSHALRHSTIGAEGFHGRVRDGIGCRPLARSTRSSKTRTHLLGFSELFVVGCNELHAVGLPLRVKIKPIERLVPVSFTGYPASTPGLSTWWSSTALKGKLVSRGASRLDAFSGYLVHT